jgi:ABC-type antimicrobial peptide transport system permease subunit
VSEPALYVAPAVFETLAGGADLSGALRITTKGDPAAVMPKLDDALFAIGATPTLMFSRAAFRESASDHFVILLVLLGGAAAAALLVGGLGLGAAMSIAVTERSREIGVMRAIGGADGRIQRLFLGEGLLVASLAILTAILLALPLAWLISLLLGEHGLHVAIPFRISSLSIALWVGAALLIALLASWLPVRRALAVPARAMLAYE